MKYSLVILLCLTGYITLLHIENNRAFIDWYKGSSALCCGACATGSVGSVGYSFDLQNMLLRPYTICPNGSQKYYYQDYLDSV